MCKTFWNVKVLRLLIIQLYRKALAVSLTVLANVNTNIKVRVGDEIVAVSEDFYRPTDVVNLWGDPTKAKNELGWNPSKTSFEQLVKIMVDSDMAKVAVERASEKVKMNLAEYLEKGIVK